jgi:hypothetical protein
MDHDPTTYLPSRYDLLARTNKVSTHASASLKQGTQVQGLCRQKSASSSSTRPMFLPINYSTEANSRRRRAGTSALFIPPALPTPLEAAEPIRRVIAPLSMGVAAWHLLRVEASEKTLVSTV